MKKIIVTVTYPWVGIEDDKCEYTIDEEESKEDIEIDAYNSAIDIIFNKVSYYIEDTPDDKIKVVIEYNWCGVEDDTYILDNNDNIIEEDIYETVLELIFSRGIEWNYEIM